ncbi:VAN3-binding protein [Diospyros lotus]|uniref:VAN3-binding protein n=1 Tax=Diospyros lotus TaxID=55363 RepID=UPI0022570E95|nr:VAN3-binding protein [Diospyros lotus]
MDSIVNPTVSEAHPETMDFLSRAWCQFAVQTFQPELQEDRSIILHENSIRKLEGETKSPFPKMEKSAKMEDADRTMPSWKSNDVKSWIWMQQAMHPELNYSSCFRKKWFPWKIAPLKHVSIKKWLKEIKEKRKDDRRLQRAEVHAAISVAGVAAALAAIAAENSKHDASTTTKDSAVASAAALVAAQCAQVAEAMGAKKEQLGSAISAAMSGTTTSDIVTLTAAAATSLRGAAALKARTACKNRLNWTAPVLPIDQENNHFEFDFEKYRSILAKGADLHIETSDRRCMVRSVSIILTNEAKVILKTKKINVLNVLASKKESIVLDLQAELYEDSETDTCYLIVLTTNKGVIKIDMADDYSRYKAWAATINHMLMISTSLTKHELQFSKF